MIIPEDIVITHKRNKKVVDSRAKGARGEYLVRDLLREHTGLQFERVPMSLNSTDFWMLVDLRRF